MHWEWFAWPCRSPLVFRSGINPKGRNSFMSTRAGLISLDRNFHLNLSVEDLESMSWCRCWTSGGTSSTFDKRPATIATKATSCGFVPTAWGMGHCSTRSFLRRQSKSRYQYSVSRWLKSMTGSNHDIHNVANLLPGDSDHHGSSASAIPHGTLLSHRQSRQSKLEGSFRRASPSLVQDGLRVLTYFLPPAYGVDIYRHCTIMWLFIFVIFGCSEVHWMV